jgi:glycosyltransferase involved in cell wall biosynthesis
LSAKPNDLPGPKSEAGSSSVSKPTVFFFANGVYGEHVAGGDLHFIEVARAAAEAGCGVNVFGSKVLETRLKPEGLDFGILLTSERAFTKSAEQSVSGQLRLLLDYFLRALRNFKYLSRIGRDDFGYAIADSWCDTVPLALSKAGCKMLVLHMQAPSLREILFRSRPDVDRFRMAALHYWGSQRLSLLLLRLTRRKHIFYVHPNMREQLLNFGFRPSEISPMSFGLDTITICGVPEPEKTYDLAWIGRVHRQKGIEDLLEALRVLASKMPGFRAVLIGKGAEQLRPDIERLKLTKWIDFPGLVSEHDKMRLLKASRIFLMPSRHEGSPRTVGEALACRVPVVAYDVPNYRPLFGPLVRYVRRFDMAALQQEAEFQITEMRAGRNYLQSTDVKAFQTIHSWDAVRAVFLSTVENCSIAISSGPRPARDRCDST